MRKNAPKKPIKPASRSVVTHKERAELYKDQFSSKSLTVTIEPAE